MKLRPEPRLDARACVGHIRLCLQHRTWQGTMGNWAGAGTGSSIDFQDHRPYMPGDDPRYIDWAAYARSGQTIMKLYREEVSPKLDLLLDVSRSMLFDDEKRDMFLRLALFCVESASSISASLRITAISGSAFQELPLESMFRPTWTPPELPGSRSGPDLSRLPLRTGSLRLLISDLLYPDPPEEFLRGLCAHKGRTVLLVPYQQQEESPDWQGNLELIDCETQTRRRQRVEERLLQRYRDAYARHLHTWREQARRYDVRLARVPSGKDLAGALQEEAFRQGVVETWG